MDRWTIYGVLKACREGRGNSILKQPHLKMVQGKISVKMIEEMNPVEIKEGLLEFLSTVALIPKIKPIELEEDITNGEELEEKRSRSYREYIERLNSDEE